MSKTVVITGSARGIGKALALAFAGNGYNVVINSKNTVKQGKEVADQCALLGVRAIYVQADVSTELGAKQLADRVLSVFGGVDCLINNAGVAQSKLLIDCDQNDVNNILFHNLGCVVFSSKAFIKNLCDSKGCIINISSMLAKSNASNESLYAASKAGVLGFTQALACEYASCGVRVNAIAPGFIETDMTACFSEQEKLDFAQNTPLGRIGSPKDICGAALFLASSDSSFITGSTIFVDGGITIS